MRRDQPSFVQAVRPTELTAVFVVPGRAAGKARPRVTRSGTHTYTPDPGGYVARVTAYGLERRQELGLDTWEGPISLDIHVERQMPTTWSKAKRKRYLEIPAPHVPDTVNIAAAVCDALEGIYYYNDRQVCDVRARQTWGEEHLTTISVAQYAG